MWGLSELDLSAWLDQNCTVILLTFMEISYFNNPLAFLKTAYLSYFIWQFKILDKLHKAVVDR
jgi:hypothetical protein